MPGLPAFEDPLHRPAEITREIQDGFRLLILHVEHHIADHLTRIYVIP